jgi:hypothetical protein
MHNYFHFAYFQKHSIGIQIKAYLMSIRNGAIGDK